MKPVLEVPVDCGSCAQSGRILASCPYCGGTGVIPESFCHCGKPTVNVMRTLCAEHIDELVAARRRAEEARIAALRAEFRYFIPDGDLGIDFRDEGPWRSYEVTGACGNTRVEFFSSLLISEVDQDGGELAHYAFDDAPAEVQRVILTLTGIDCGHDGEDTDPKCPGCQAAVRKSAIDAGIPASVVDGKTKLIDHFSPQYIASQANPKGGDDPNDLDSFLERQGQEE